MNDCDITTEDAGTISNERTSNRKDLSKSREWSSGNLISSEFLVKQKLGQGGMGIVYLVERISDGSLFAVKRMRHGINRNSERQLLNELQTWIDLPDTPHIVKCKFFKTIEGQLSIFSEYISGGSLSSWISGQRCSAIPLILDLAIQYAWGLHLAHACGITHRDVKPSNALVTEDGTLKVTDFGLARYGSTGKRQTRNSEFDRSSVQGFTPAYCAPEQLVGSNVTFKADIWSWGITLIEMFAKKLPWQLGAVAAYSLDRSSLRSILPAPVYEVIRLCLRDNPDDRWSSILDAADALIEYCERNSGPYTRAKPRFPESNLSNASGFERLTADGITWIDPSSWLRKEDSGREHLINQQPDPANVTSISWKAKAIQDLKLYGDAIRICTNRIKAGHHELIDELLLMLQNKALLHSSLNDLPGAIDTCDESIRIAGSLATSEFPNPISLVSSLEKKTLFLMMLGDTNKALDICEKCISSLNADESGDAILKIHLANAHINRGNSLMVIMRFEDAAESYEIAITTLMNNRQWMNQTEFQRLISIAYQNSGIIFFKMGKTQKALDYQKNVVMMRTSLVNEHGQKQMRNSLAASLNNLGEIHLRLNQIDDSERCFLQAIHIREQLVFHEHRSELESSLAAVYVNLGNLHYEQDRLALARQYAHQSIRMLHTAVIDEDKKNAMHYYISAGILKAKLDVNEGQHAIALKELQNLTELIHSSPVRYPNWETSEHADEIRKILESIQ